MKIIVALLLVLAAWNANAAIQSLLKQEVKGANDVFPESFFFNSTTMTPNGVPGDAIFRVDGYNNLFSYSYTFFNTGVGKNVTQTWAFDYPRNVTYMHTTDRNMCFNQTMSMTLPMNVVDFIDKVWQALARVAYEKEERGHHLMGINIAYNSDYNVTFHNDNDNLVRINGTFTGISQSHNITTGITPKYFQRRDHIPTGC